MKLAALAALFLVVAESRRILQDTSDEPSLGDFISGTHATGTVFSLGGGDSGIVQVTGMLQNFPLDQDQPEVVNSLLDRPRTSYVDVSWPHWIDQRLEMLDLFQELISAPVRPRCAQMQTSTSVMDNGMVSYLASSRFGPAILTTYAQQEEEDPESDFDWDNVNIPEGEPIGRSYEDASLQDELSADADKAFKLAELESRLMHQDANVGYFSANMRGSKDQVLYNGLDGDSESLQPVILTHPEDLRVFTDSESSPQPISRVFEEDLDEGPEASKTQLAVAILLFIGCCYIWTYVIYSCKTLGKEEGEDRQKTANDLLIPLAPEGLQKGSSVQIASKFVAPGAYYAPHGASFSKIKVPLLTAEHS